MPRIVKMKNGTRVFEFDVESGTDDHRIETKRMRFELKDTVGENLIQLIKIMSSL